MLVVLNQTSLNYHNPLNVNRPNMIINRKQKKELANDNPLLSLSENRIIIRKVHDYLLQNQALPSFRLLNRCSRQRKDFVVKTARTLCTSNDVIVLENLNVRGLVKNHQLALSISDASWSIFREWLEYFGKIFNREIIAVDPKFTSQDCSNCGQRIKKSLSTRTHQCSCGTILCRDHNAAINILSKGMVGQTKTSPTYGVNASGQMTLWLIDENLATKVAG